MSFPALVANAPCLELANTVNNWHAPRRDLLADREPARAWAELVVGGAVRPLSGGDLDALRALRTDLRSVFGPLASGGTAAPDALDRVLMAHAAGLSAARWAATGATYTLEWPSPPSGAHLAARLAGSAVELLTRGPLDRVGECPGCGWLFLDTSRNGRRTWCSMDMCGGRDKARRYYERRQAAAGH